ncbi:hypothetical protein BLA29_011158, partial [Euroglyphus maynei]
QKELNEDDDDNEIDTGKVLFDKDEENLLECYEHKRFGSDFISTHFNRSIITRMVNRNDLDRKMEEFETKYTITARMFDIDLVAGQINLSKQPNNSRLTLNLFGSTYENLNLCEIRDKDYSQSGIIPLIVNSIWFKTNIGLKIHYKLNLKLDIPFLNCEGSPSNDEILTRAMNNELQLKQNSIMEFSAIAEANFLVSFLFVS